MDDPLGEATPWQPAQFRNIDPNVERVGVSKLRNLNANNLRSNRKTLVIQDNDTALAVLLSYDQFLVIQKRLESLAETIALLTNENDLAALVAGIQDQQAGRTKSIQEVRAALKGKQ